MLSKIVANRRTHLPQIRRELAAQPPRARAHYSLERALRAARKSPRPVQSSFGLILECKAASPSLGPIATDYNPAQLARAYAPYASGISVLVEPDYFSGSYEHLRAVCDEVQLPVLCKDFIISREQIHMAHACGADVVLLMLSVLDDETYRDLHECADELGLEVLTEVLTPEEAERARQLGAHLVDINHRNLHTLKIDLGRARELAPLVRGSEGPADEKMSPQGHESAPLIIAASGLDSAEQLYSLSDIADGYLVGSALSGAPDASAALKKLVYGNIKICGLNSTQTARLAQEYVQVAGVNLVKSSPRYVTEEQAVELLSAAPDLKWVGVVLAEMVENLGAEEHGMGLGEVASAELLSRLDGLQVHGPVVGCEKQLACELRKWFGEQALLVRALPKDESEGNLKNVLELGEYDFVIVDAPQPGSGKTWNPTSLPEQLRAKIWYAGGLNCENFREIRASGAGGLDFNSGLESAPGIKCPDKLVQLKTALLRATL